MSPADSAKRQSGGPFRKPRADVYTVLLILTLIALLLGILCLYFEMEMYEWKMKSNIRVSVDRPAAVELASAERFGTFRPPANSGFSYRSPIPNS